MWLILSYLLALTPEQDGTPEYLYKLLSPAAWQQSQGSDRLVLGPDDTVFIHLAEAEQVDRIAKKFFSEHAQVVVIQLKTDDLPGRLVKEANPGGTTKYYHLYDGYLPFEAVVSHRMHDTR